MNPVTAANPAKAALRATVLARRDGLDPHQRAAASEAIAGRIMAILAEERPRTIAAYLPIRSECDSRLIIERARTLGIAIALPAVTDPVTMVFRRHDADVPLVAGAFGTLMPAAGQPILDPELVIMPMVAFDRAGLRLGHGRGFYDRALATLAVRGIRPKLIGVAFAAQEVETIPSEPHDARLDWIVTEEETLKIASEQARR